MCILILPIQGRQWRIPTNRDNNKRMMRDNLGEGDVTERDKKTLCLTIERGREIRGREEVGNNRKANFNF